MPARRLTFGRRPMGACARRERTCSHVARSRIGSQFASPTTVPLDSRSPNASRSQDHAERAGPPLLAVGRGDAALVEVDDDRRERLASEHPGGGLTNHLGLLRHDLDLALGHSPVPVGATAAMGVAAFGVLAVLGADTLADASRLVLGCRSEHLGREPAARRVEIDVAGSDCSDLDAGRGDHLGQLDQVGEPAVQPVGVVGDDHVDLTSAHEIEQALVLGSAGTGVGAQGPALQNGQLAARIDLSPDSGSLADLVQRDPGVDRSTPEQRGCVSGGVRLSLRLHPLRWLLGCSGPPSGVPPVGAAQRDVITSEISRWCCPRGPCRRSGRWRSSRPRSCGR